MRVYFSIKFAVSTLAIAVLFLSFVVMVGPSVLTMHVPTVKAQGSSMPSAIATLTVPIPIVEVSDDSNFAFMAKNPVYSAYFKNDSYTAKHTRVVIRNYVVEFNIA